MENLHRCDKDSQLEGSLKDLTAQESVSRGERFAFGKNWQRYLAGMNAEKIASAEDSLRSMLGKQNLVGLRFLDAGCGSGLFSLAARRLGADVVSFDFDEDSVKCARTLKQRFADGDAKWTIESGSVLDQEYLARLGNFDIAYSWGVLHHTGDMWCAIENISKLVRAQGQLFIAIYNDQGWTSRYWHLVKRLYNRFLLLRPVMILVYAPYFVGARYIVRTITGKRKLERGMSFWYDMIDWLGGLPFETATPEMICEFFLERGFTLQRLRTCGGRSGCNEFVFEKSR